MVSVRYAAHFIADASIFTRLRQSELVAPRRKRQARAMVTTSPSSTNLLAAAKSFMRRSAGSAALAIAPLAAISLANPAHAQAVFNTPSSFGTANVSGSSFVSVTGPGGFFSSALPASNGITGVLFGANVSYTLTSNSGGTLVDQALKIGGSVSSGTFSGETIPVAFSFTLSTPSGGSVSSLAWSVQIYKDNSLTGLSIASGTGVGSFTGSGTFNAGTGTWNTYTIVLQASYVSGVNTTLALTTDQNNAQGFAINATAIPEPSTYAAWFGFGAGLVAAGRRLLRRRSAT